MASENQQVCPPWITLEMVKNLVEKADANATLQSFSVKNAFEKVEWMCSNMFRISASCKANNECYELHFLVKAAMTSEIYEEMADNLSFFSREIVVYNDVFPKAYQLLSAAGDKAAIAPKYVVVNCVY